MTTTTGISATTTSRTSPPPAAADVAGVASALATLRATEAGREVAGFVTTNRVDVRVVPDAAFRGHFRGAGAVYDPRTGDITIPRGALGHASLVTTLAHEGTHARDYAERPHWLLHALGALGGSAVDGVRALVTFRNPVTAWLDSMTARRNEAEVHAYEVQAQVAHELGIDESRWALGQAPGGEPLPRDEVRARVATDDLYRMDPGQRLLLGSALGFGATASLAFTGQSLAAQLRPGSFLAAHGWPLYAIGGAMVGAWVVGDQVRARHLESAG